MPPILRRARSSRRLRKERPKTWTGRSGRRAALGPWQSLSPHTRARYLYAVARQVQKHSRRLAVLETIDNGKPIRESRDIRIPLVARHFYYHAGWPQLLETEWPGYAPCGVVGQIILNFPLLMLAWKIAPALATGNTVILKPAEFTPLTAWPLRTFARKLALRRALSLLSPATARPANRWSGIRGSTRSRLPARPSRPRHSESNCPKPQTTFFGTWRQVAFHRF